MVIPGIFLYTVFFASVFFSWRAITSISIFLLLALGLYAWIDSGKKPFFSRPFLFFAGGMILQFLLILVFQFFHGFFPAEISLKTGMMAVPFALVVSWPLVKKKTDLILTIYCLLLFVATVYCLFTSEKYFYHDLVKPIHQHAVYFSIYILLAIFFLQQKYSLHFLNDPLLRHGLSFYFSVFILLLSSKLIICFLMIYWIHRFALDLGIAWKLGGTMALLIVAGLVLFTGNPIGRRFRDSFSGDPALNSRDHFDPGIYFNGVQFRLLQWKLVPHILNRENAWISGVGPEQAQPALNTEYRERNMYLGDGKNEKGYQAYNSHNQLLESLLRYGIPGLAIFIFIFLVLLYLGISVPSFGGGLIMLLIMVYSLVESLWETQYGIIIFCGLPFFIDLVMRSQPLRPLKRLYT